MIRHSIIQLKWTAATVFSIMFVSACSAGSDWGDFPFDRPGHDPLEVLDPGYHPDAPWAEAVHRGDRVAAASALVKELREGPPRVHLEDSIPAVRLRWFGTRINENAGMAFKADDVVRHIYTGAYGITHRFEDGIDWSHDPTGGKTGEWTWGFNRHFHWLNLADAYHETGDAKYARAWEKELRSWIDQMPRPSDTTSRRGCGWRTLDTGIRAGSVWPYVFEIFRRSPHVSDQSIWMMFCAQREKAIHLMASRAGGNWRVMESNGLGHVGILFPEMKGSGGFTSTALQRAKEELASQFFPDGTHQEFAPHYAAAGCIANFHVLATLATRNGQPFPPDFQARLAKAAQALARIAFPDGIVPALHNSREVVIPSLFAEVATRFDPESHAEAPWMSGQSDLIPFGGYAVLRRGGRHAMLDAGPRGTSHFHDDDLQVLTHAYGRKFGVDPGTPRYTAEAVSRHLRSSSAHNVVLLDGRNHIPAVEIFRPREPMPFSFHGDGPVHMAAARRSLKQTAGEEKIFQHERVLLDIEDLGWVVFDHLTPPVGYAKHTWEWIWGMDVDRIEINQTGAWAVHQGGPALQVMAAGNPKISLSMAAGKTEPDIRGWILQPVVEEYIPLPTLRIQSEALAGPVWLFTVKIPHEDNSPADSARIAGVRAEGDSWLLAVNRHHRQYRVGLEGDGNQIRKVTVWRGSEKLADLAMGEHTL